MGGPGWEPRWDFPATFKLFVRAKLLDKPIVLALAPLSTPPLLGHISNILRLNYIPFPECPPPQSLHPQPELHTNKLLSSYWLSKNMAALRCEMLMGLRGAGLFLQWS